MVEETDVEGFNLACAVTHETFSDVADHLVPELQRRGVFKKDYAAGTLREKLFGAGPRLPTTIGARGAREARVLRSSASPKASAMGLRYYDGLRPSLVSNLRPPFPRC